MPPPSVKTQELTSTEVLDEVVFRPSDEQRRTKAAFWVHHA